PEVERAPRGLTPPAPEPSVQRSGGATGWTTFGVTVPGRATLAGDGRAPLVIGGLTRLTSESAFAAWMAWTAPAFADSRMLVEPAAVPHAVSSAAEIRIAGSRFTPPL